MEIEELAARAFWLREPGHGEIRDVELSRPGESEVLVRALYSGVSRGTETLVFRGGVPENQYGAMRAPFQDGDFPGPVKYGYLNVGVVEHGPPDLLGRTVFCLYPHQTQYVVAASAVLLVPDGVPARRAHARRRAQHGQQQHLHARPHGRLLLQKPRVVCVVQGHRSPSGQVSPSDRSDK